MPGDLSVSDAAVALPAAPRPSTPPVSSLRPVDIQSPPVPSTEGEGNLAIRRERLRKIVLGTLAGCGLILIAAAGAEVARASASTGSSQPVAVLARAPEPASVGPTPATAVATPEPPAAPEAPSIGTLRLHAPAVPGHVWLDGEKVTASSTVVACGKHELRVGAKGHPHTVDVPCGGEFRVSR
jgi:hypothetical protein